MKKLISVIFLILLLGCDNQKSHDLKTIISDSEKQLDYAFEVVTTSHTGNLIFPRSAENEILNLVPASDWTSGFFPGNLWMMYELTHKEKWKERALQFTAPLEPEKWDGSTHDIGFKMFCSFGKAMKYTGGSDYKEILVQSAKTLSSRFNPTVGCLSSWDTNKEKWDFPVTIDNIMNIELLFWAARETGNRNFSDIAIKHAEVTLKNHFRPDHSSYHIIDYNPKTGEIQNKLTVQGYSKESAWARGQARGLYGFTLMYRETGRKKFLIQAEDIAGYILNQPCIKNEGVPYWDFKAPATEKPLFDASAGAIIASALYELSEFSEYKCEYLKAADKMLNALSSPKFRAAVGENNGFLLKHSTGSKPGNIEVDVPVVYADYYFLEALIRKRNQM